MAEELILLADRVHRYAAPPWVVFKALVDDNERDIWLVQAPREVPPKVLEQEPHRRVLWSSLWPVSPDDQIEFSIVRDGAGSSVRMCWRSNNPPDERGVGITRQRLNRYLGGHLRGWIDSASSPITWPDAPRDLSVETDQP